LQDLHDSNSIVVEDGWDVFRRELVGRVRDEQASLSHSSIAHDDALDSSDNHIDNGLSVVEVPEERGGEVNLVSSVVSR